MKQYATLATVEPLDNYRIFIKFADGTQGVVSFAEDIQQGVFRRLASPSEFAKLKIVQFGTVLTWDIDAPELEIPDACADWLFEQVVQHS